MGDICKIRQCKTKLSEYREMTSKLYDDIDSLETDIKDKDKFVQTVVKARNALQEEVSNLKKKNSDLLKENCDLSEKVDQLDEDTDTGLELLKNAHERERKLNEAFEEYKKKGVINEEKVSNLTKENEELTSKFLFLKNQFEKSLKANQETSTTKDARIEHLENEFIELKKISEHHIHETECVKIKLEQAEIEIMDKTVQVQESEIEKNTLKQKNNDLNDELVAKIKEIVDIEERTSLKSSQSSLKEELSRFQTFECNKCEKTFMNKANLQGHELSTHGKISKLKSDLKSRIDMLEKRVYEQKSNVASSLFKLKKKENEESQLCTCKTYCRIYHKKHNYVKSKSEDLFAKLGMTSENPHKSIINEVCGIGARRKQYTCNQCDQIFHKQGHLKKHRKHEHKRREVEIGEVTEYCQKGRMS